MNSLFEQGKNVASRDWGAGTRDWGLEIGDIVDIDWRCNGDRVEIHLGDWG
jgi:hypothetical protein